MFLSFVKLCHLSITLFIFLAYQVPCLAGGSADLEICLQEWLSNKYIASPLSDKPDPTIKSQTLSFLELEPFEKIIKTIPHIDLSDHIDWLRDIVNFEDRYKDEYYVFYHACSGLSLFHDLLTKAIATKLNITVPDDFIFMRIPGKDSFQFNDVEDYFSKEGLPILQFQITTQKRYIDIILELLEIPPRELTKDDTLQLYNNFRLYWKSMQYPKYLESPDVLDRLSWTLKTISWNGSQTEFLDQWKLKIGGQNVEPSVLDERGKILRNELIFIHNNEQNLIYSGVKSVLDHLLCANLTLLGNYDTLGECTLAYWYYMFNCRPNDNSSIILETLKLFDLNEESIKELMEIYDIIQDEDAVIYGIFIPKTIINRISYVSDSYYNPINYENMTISQILKAYQTDIRSIASYKSLQARLLFTNKYLLNPFSGIKFVRNHTIVPEKYQKYRSQLDQWLEANLKSAVIAH